MAARRPGSAPRTRSAADAPLQIATLAATAVPGVRFAACFSDLAHDGDVHLPIIITTAYVLRYAPLRLGARSPVLGRFQDCAVLTAAGPASK